MDLQSMFSDDQLAVMGCFLALAVCGGIAALSFQFGPAGRKSAPNQTGKDIIHAIRPGTSASADSSGTEETRRAA